MNPAAWILLGGVVAFLALVAVVGWRIGQAAKSLAGIAEIVGSTSTTGGCAASKNETCRESEASVVRGASG